MHIAAAARLPHKRISRGMRCVCCWSPLLVAAAAQQNTRRRQDHPRQRRRWRCGCWVARVQRQRQVRRGAEHARPSLVCNSFSSRVDGRENRHHGRRALGRGTLHVHLAKHARRRGCARQGCKAASSQCAAGTRGGAGGRGPRTHRLHAPRQPARTRLRKRRTAATPAAAACRAARRCRRPCQAAWRLAKTPPLPSPGAGGSPRCGAGRSCVRRVQLLSYASLPARAIPCKRTRDARHRAAASHAGDVSRVRVHHGRRDAKRGRGE
jgi:hypothetical protein